VTHLRAKGHASDVTVSGTKPGCVPEMHGKQGELQGTLLGGMESTAKSYARAELSRVHRQRVLYMTDEAILRDWLSEHCPYVWSLLNGQARRQLPFGLLEYLSPQSEEQLDILAETMPELHRDYPLSAHLRQQFAERWAADGRQHIMTADEYAKEVVETCGRKAVEDGYRRQLSGVATGEQVAEFCCEMAFCTAVSRLSSTPPRLRPPSGRPGRNTHCDVMFRVGDIPVYGEVKRYLDPWLRDQLTPDGKYELASIDLYRKLQDVPEQFPEGQVNLLFVLHPSFNS
jgi:hypothetical protein